MLALIPSYMYASLQIRFIDAHLSHLSSPLVLELFTVKIVLL